MQVSIFKIPFLLLNLILWPGCFIAKAQDCPPNIDFETGTFKGWQCYTGIVEAFGGKNTLELAPQSAPVYNRQTMYTANTGEGVDPYGGFPVNCPNGSKHSIRLGNAQGGNQAEAISYEFTIPSNMNVYSLIYNYAVVFQDPDHAKFEQPRFEVEITNESDHKIIECSSFTFIPYGNILPGFFESPNPAGDTPVWCKDWSAVSVNLDGNAGKRIKILFTTADCTLHKHFGYAYIDINSQCSSEFVGNRYCIDDTSVNLVAPYGYQHYTWYDSSFSEVLGTKQTLKFEPPPPPGSIYPVSLEPYNGYGCTDTLYAKLEKNLTVKSNAGKDTLSCNRIPVPIGSNTIPGLVYSWKPTLGLSDPTISNPVANPPKQTTYILTTENNGGGCRSTDTVVVRTSKVDNSLRLTGDSMFCTNIDDSAVLHVIPTKGIQWYNGDRLINSATSQDYWVSETGIYHALLTNNDGCMIPTKNQNIVIDNPTSGIRYPDEFPIINLPFDLKARQLGGEVLWSPGISLNTRTSFTPVFTGYTGQSEQLYTIRIKTKGGCTTVDTLLVKPIDKVKMYVPTAFTPNGDGLNDILRPVLFGIKKLHYFKIYSRIGNQLFETRAPGVGWDGTFKGIPQSSQVVVWILEGVGLDNKIYRLKGSSLLVR